MPGFASFDDFLKYASQHQPSVIMLPPVPRVQLNRAQPCRVCPFLEQPSLEAVFRCRSPVQFSTTTDAIDISKVIGMCATSSNYSICACYRGGIVPV